MSSANISGGTSGTDGTDDRLIFNTGSQTGLTLAQLNEITFNGVGGAAQIQLGNSNYFEISEGPVPEPTTILAGVLLLGFIALRERRRLKSLAELMRTKKA